MPALRYLTVQDVLWISTLVTGASRRFRVLDLEESAYYQYGYGASVDLLRQAARFLNGFLKKAPFESGNEATAFVAFAAFLRLNGQALTIEDSNAVRWLSRAAELESQDVAKVIVDIDPSAHRENVEEAVHKALDAFPKTVAELAGASSAAA